MKTTPEENTREPWIEEFFELQGKHTHAVREGKLDPNVADEKERQFLNQQLQKAQQEEREAFCTILERLYQAGDERKQMTFEYLMRIRAKDAVKTPDHSELDQDKSTLTVVQTEDGDDYMDVCQHCHCMTKLMSDGTCGKCGGHKAKVTPKE